MKSKAPEQQLHIKKHVLVSFLLGLGLRFLRIIPLPAMRLIGLRLGYAMGYLPMRDVKRCRAHLRRAYPDADEQWIHKTCVRCFGHFGRTMFSTLRLLNVNNKDLYKAIKVEGYENLLAHRAAHERGEGTILLGGHFGNWELQMRFMGLAGQIFSVGKKLRSEFLDDFVVTHMRTKNNNAKIIYQEQGLLPCARALRRGGSVTMVPDQDLPRFPGIFSPWFGIPAYTPSGPAKLARNQGVAIQPCYFYEHAGYFVFHWGPRKTFEKTDNDEADVQAMTDWIMAYQEQLVRRHPEQWVWWHKRWRTQPEDIASVNE